MPRTTPLDIPLGKVALQLINLFGKDLTYKGYGPSVYNDITGKTTRAETDYPVRGVFERVTKELVGDGSLVKWSDRVVYIPARNLTFTPDNAGKLQDGAKVLTVVTVDEIRSGELVAAYALVVRG